MERDAICKASDLFFGQKDLFLTMTIFVSLKTLFRIRLVCKSFNSWLSDPNNFSWQRRIENAFPLSYEDILKEELQQKIERLMVFDTLVEAGHQLSYYSLDDLTAVKEAPVKQRGTKSNGRNGSLIPIISPGRLRNIAVKTRTCKKKLQLPWRKDLFIFSFINSSTIVFFSTMTRSNIAEIDLPWNPFQILFNIKDRKIGFISSSGVLKLYNVVGNDLIHEQDLSINVHSKSAVPQIYGDILLLKSDDGNEIEFTLFSISKNMAVSDFTIKADCSFEAASMIEPVVYSVIQKWTEYTIYKIDCINGTATEICSNKLNVENDREGDGIRSVELIENEERTVLKIYQKGCLGSAVDLIDVKNQRVILSQHCGQDNHKVYAKSKAYYAKSDSYYSEAWKNLQYNLGTYFYSTMSHGRSGQVLTIGRVDQPFYTAAEPLDYDKDGVPDEPAVFSKCYHVNGAMGRSQDFRSQWLNNDILAFQVQSSTREYFGRQTDLKRLKPMNWVERFWSTVRYYLMFYSIEQKRVVGCIDDEIKEIYVDGNNVIAFNKENGVYDIKLDMFYYENSRRGKKRKLDAILKEQIKAMKKAKLHQK